VRWKSWKWYYTMAQPGAEGWIMPLIPFHWALVTNLKRDPFEQAVGTSVKSAFWIGGSLGAPMTALQYELALFPIGTKLWLEQLNSYRTYPPMQSPSSYNLDAVIARVKAADSNHPSD
jgi:hypothetical protein